MDILFLFKCVLFLAQASLWGVVMSAQSPTTNNELPKWIQSTYYTNLHCDGEIIHGVTYPLSKCIRTTIDTYAMMVPFSTTDKKTNKIIWNIKWKLFQDFECKKMSSDSLAMRDVDESHACRGPADKTEFGDGVVYSEKLFWTKEPPPFTFSGPRFTWYDDKDCGSLIRDQVVNLNYCRKGDGGVPVAKDAPTPSYRMACSDVSLVSVGIE